jgi:hypothetical protein
LFLFLWVCIYDFESNCTVFGKRENVCINILCF